MSDGPLNPLLYRALVGRFGESHVQIVAPGVEISWALSSPAAGDPGALPSRKVLNPGEEYLVRCPFCRDWKPRMYINHRWGVWDPDTRSNNMWLFQCFNEHCETDKSLQDALFMMLFGGRPGRRQVEILPGRSVDVTELKEAEFPGPVIRLDELAERSPRHKALEYLRDRHFDPIRLAKLYGVGYCPHSRYGFAADRIIIPVYERGILYGWQARFIGDSANGVPLKDLGVPKYWTMPQMPRKVIGYNMDVAAQHQTIVIVEGPMDVWGVGPQAFGLLAKTISPLLVRKLNAWIDLYWRDEVTIVVLLDPDQDPVSLRKGKPHHINVACDVLRQNLRHGIRDRVLPVFLPPKTDPGSLERDFTRHAIRQAAVKAGLNVTFSARGRRPRVDNSLLEFKTNYRGS